MSYYALIEELLLKSYKKEMNYYALTVRTMKDGLFKISKLSQINCGNPTDCLLITC